MKQPTISSVLFFLLTLSSFHSQSESLRSTSKFKPDFSYMKLVHDATEANTEEEYYDYIIVGGGTAGCPLATTLSSNFSVLVIERGNVPLANPYTLKQEGLITIFSSPDDETTAHQRFTSVEGVNNERGRVLGGTSMTNLGFYSRAHEEFFHQPGVVWDREDVEKAYQWVEETLLFEFELLPWQAAFREALLEGGFVPDNGQKLNQVTGTKTGASTFDGNGRRHGAVELLNKANPKNLKIVVNAFVEKVIFSSSGKSKKAAVGVIYSDSKGKLHTAKIHKKGEVILSAGALGTPQLLQLSGVGPKSYLSKLNIPLVVDHPFVGEYMIDNPRNNINLLIPFHLGLSNIQVVGSTKEYIFLEAISYPVPFTFTSPFGVLPVYPNKVNFSVASICDKFPVVLSHGSLRLATTDVRKNPIISFNYFTDPKDLAQCVTAMRLAAKVLNTPALDKFKIQDLEGMRSFAFLGKPFPKDLSDKSLGAYCKETVTTFWHYHGGSIVGKVVDGDRKFIGIDSLRIVDGSTFFISPGTNPQATVMMLGRYVGLQILKERLGHSG